MIPDRPIRLAVFGDPVAHSRSPAMHTAALEALGIPGSYRAVRVDEAGLGAQARAIREGSLDGANITMPYKRAAHDLCDVREGPAARARSVNTWWRQDGRLHGTSTDVPGIHRAWTLRGMPDDAPVLVLGAGGAAAAALVALEARTPWVSARRPEAAVALARITGVECTPVPWGRIPPGAVVVNCTPIGMGGEALPVDLDEASGLFEMAYGEEETPAVEAARARGLPVADGIDLLVAQAELSFRIWTGREAPAGVMERAARKGSSTP